VLLEGATEGALLKEANLQKVPEIAVELLLEARADVNLSNQEWGEGRTLLHEAAHSGDVVLLRKAIAAGADIDRRDVKLGFSALHLASRARKDEVVKLLVEAKADTSLQSAGGKTAAELGAKNGLSAASLALLRGQEEPESQPSVPSTSGGYPAASGLASLTPEQRALLFID